jgi:hypothetical protein
MNNTSVVETRRCSRLNSARVRIFLMFAPLLIAGAGCGSAGSDPPSLATCARATTVAEFETKFIVPTCGKGNGSCHSSGLFSPNLSDGPLSAVLLDKAPTRFCLSNKLIDSKTPADSLVLTKIHQNPPHCPGTTTAAGDPMPWHMPALSDADKACMDGYVQMVATGK